MKVINVFLHCIYIQLYSPHFFLAMISRPRITCIPSNTSPRWHLGSYSLHFVYCHRIVSARPMGADSSAFNLQRVQQFFMYCYTWASLHPACLNLSFQETLGTCQPTIFTAGVAHHTFLHISKQCICHNITYD